MPENNFTLDQDLTLLSQIAKSAGDLALRFYGQSPRVWMKEGNSPVSEADVAVDNLIKERLLQQRPNYGWISEESVDERPAGQNFSRFFVIDPIDGTRGFLAGSPQWCISLAIIEAGSPIAGVIYCPALNECYSARRDGCALLNGKAINVDKLAGQKLRLNAPKPLSARVLEQLPDVRVVEEIPSLAYRIALVAAGKLDIVMVRPSCHDWDIAAADIILTTAGGLLTDAHGQRVIYGTLPYCHPFLLAFEKERRAMMLNLVQAAKLV